MKNIFALIFSSVVIISSLAHANPHLILGTGPVDLAYRRFGEVSLAGMDAEKNPCEVKINFYFKELKDSGQYIISAMYATILNAAPGRSATYSARVSPDQIVDGPQCPELKENSDQVFHLQNAEEQTSPRVCHEWKSRWGFKFEELSPSDSRYTVIADDGETFICKISN